MANTLSDIISDELISCIVQIESKGDPNAKAETSSATGLGQHIDKTWMACIKRYRPDLLRGRTRKEVLALRREPKLSLEMTARLAEENIAIIGRNATAGDIYLAHFSGPEVARKVMRAPADAMADRYFSEEQIAANEKNPEGQNGRPGSRLGGEENARCRRQELGRGVYGRRASADSVAAREAGRAAAW